MILLGRDPLPRREMCERQKVREVDEVDRKQDRNAIGNTNDEHFEFQTAWL